MKNLKSLTILFLFLLVGCDTMRGLRIKHIYTLADCPKQSYEMPNLILKYGWELQKEEPVKQCRELDYYRLNEEQKKFSHQTLMSRIYTKLEKGQQCRLVVINYGWCHINEWRSRCIERLQENENDLKSFYELPNKSSDKFVELLSKKGLPNAINVKRAFSDNPDDQELCKQKISSITE
jgi:hypothetical protein